MSGVWSVDVRYFETPDAEDCIATGFMMSEEDQQKNFMSIMLVRAIMDIKQARAKQALELKKQKEQKNDCEKN